MKFVLLISILTTSILVANGQYLPYGLREPKVKKELMLMTSDFDSLVLIDKASYWSEDMKISGLGFKQDLVYELTINYEQNTTSSYDMKIKNIKQEKVQNDSVMQAIRKIKFRSIFRLNNDSLNLKPSWSISDQDEWTILFLIKKQLIVIKQSYAPESYQPKRPTKTRQLFIDLFSQINQVTTCR